MNTSSSPSKSSNKKIILLLFFLILLAPYLLAIYLVNKGKDHALPLSNHGDLLYPLQNIASVSFYDLNHAKTQTGKLLLGKWWLVYVSPEKCHQTCQNNLYNMRQIRVALGKDASRLERLFIAQPECPVSVCEQYLSESYPDLLKIKMAPKDFNLLFGSKNTQEREMIGEFYIIDPKGNVMMHYAADSEAKAILSDLKRLLKVSKIG